MSETTNLKLKKHDNPETNTEKFDIENYLNGNWDKIDKNVGEVNTNISNINSKNKEQDTNIKQLQGNTETSSNKIVELEKELKEMQEDFYQSSIRGQASGEYIHVEDSSNCRAKIGIGGNHEQETRSGKNKIEITKTTTTVNGCTHTIKDGTDTLSGTSSTNWANLIIYSFVGDGKTYTLSGSPSTSKNIFISAHDNVQKKDLATSKNGSTGTFVATSGNSIDIIICVAPNLTLANELFKPQLEEGSKATGCEQGGASPSPNYPSEVKCVGSNVNLFDKDDSIINGYYIDNTGNLIQANNSWYQNAFIKVNSNMQYTISSKIAVLRVCFYDSNKQFISRATTEENNLTFTTPNNCEHIKISGNNVAEQIAELKLEKGKVATPYSKYGQGCVKVTKCNKNIFKETYNRKDLTSAYFSIVKGKGFLEKDKTYVISFDTTNNGGIVYLGEYSFQHINTFTVKCDGTRKFFTAKAKEFGYVTDITVLKTRAVTTNAYNISNVMINEYENDTDIDYIQHEEQSYIMPVQKEMLQGDYFDYDNEEEVHMWGKYTFIGEEDYQKSQTYSNDEYLCAYIPTPVINNIKIDGKGLSSHFNRIGDFTTYQNEECVRTSGQLQIRVLVSRLTENSVEGLKAYLKSQYDAGTPVVVYYQLATPTRIKFTDEQKAVAKELNNARTYKNVTNITTDSKAILSLDYVKDQETQNQKMQNEIDEIKQLLSTTQTSALLLDNMQTDIESEVG